MSADLDRDFLKRIEAMLAQARMLAMLQKRPDLLHEAGDLEERRQVLLKELEGRPAASVVQFRTRAKGDAN